MSESRARIQPVIAKTFTVCMEQLQEGYVAAVAATAGCTTEPKRRDLYRTDLEIVRPPTNGQTEEISLLVQLKNTTIIRPDPAKESFSYKFKKREYLEELAKYRSRKAILVVMATVPVQADWSKATHDSLEVQHCCYWRSLEGEPVDVNVQSPTVKIPTVNVFDATALTGLLDRLERGENLT